MSANYAAAHPEFPHEPTTDQWFGESQLESYRLLGLHAIEAICGDDWEAQSFPLFFAQVKEDLARAKRPLVRQVAARSGRVKIFSCPRLPSRNKKRSVKPRLLEAGLATRFPLASIGAVRPRASSSSLAGCRKTPEDEAKLAGLSPKDFPQITADIFKPMDGGIALTPNEIMGRNTWNLWSGGNQHFWDHVAQDSFGLMDLLKMLDNRKYARGERFKTLGLVNEPGFRAATKPDEYGLWLDEQVEPEPAGIDEKIYGKPSGVLGFRLFPNPDFDEEARQKWDGARFLNDPTYFSDNKLVRPYRVGVSCGSCHISPTSVQPAGRPGKSALGKSRLRHRQPIHPRRQSLRA